MKSTAPTNEEPRVSSPSRLDTSSKAHDHTEGRVRPVASFVARPRKSLGAEPTWKSSLNTIVTGSWVNVLLVFLPASWVLHSVWRGPHDIATFVASFLAVIPLVKLLDLATEQISLRVGEVVGGFIETTSGNVMDIAFAIILLKNCQLTIIQYSLVGALFRNLVLVPGLCFFVGGTRLAEQGFVTLTGLNMSLLMLGAGALVFPAAFHYSIAARHTSDRNSDFDESAAILKISLATACILLFVYCAYFFFQLRTRSHVYVDGITTKFKTKLYSEKDLESLCLTYDDASPVHGSRLEPQSASSGKVYREDNVSMASTKSTVIMADPTCSSERTKELANEHEAPTLNIGSTILLLIVISVLITLSANILVDSMDNITESTWITQEWAGLVLLPIVAKFAEHVTVVTSAMKNKLARSLAAAHGSSIQIMFLILPVLIIVAWIMEKPLSLLFDPFGSVSLFLAVIILNYTVAGGRTNWFEGMVLTAFYFIFCIVFWFFPAGINPQVTLGLLCAEKPSITLHWFVEQMPL